MPLKRGKSKKTMARNYKRMKKEGVPKAQRVAIMLSLAGKSKKKRR
jgi:hypothetical protein